jgi:hypothetical protein
MDVQRSKTAVVMRCTCCGLRWHMRRIDLAESVRRRIEETPKGPDREHLARLAALFAPPGGPAYDDWRKRTSWRDPSVSERGGVQR